MLAVLLAACTGSLPWMVHIPSDLRTPETAGVVQTVAQLPDGRKSYRLKAGETVYIAHQKQVLLGGEPLAGELLLAGTDPDGRQWVAGVELSRSLDRPQGCYDFPAQGRMNDGWIETTSGFRLPIAPGFHDPRDRQDDVFASDRGVFCLNERGEVTNYSGI